LQHWQIRLEEHLIYQDAETLGEFLSISTGYKKIKNPANDRKLEIWFAPRFLVERELGTTTTAYRSVFSSWKARALLGCFGQGEKTLWRAIILIA